MLIDTELRILRILHILRAPVGGLFRHVCDLAQVQAGMGHEVGIVCDATTASPDTEDWLAALARVCTLGVMRVTIGRTIGFGDIAAFAAIRHLVTRLEPNILHGHGAKGGAFVRLMPRKARAVALYTPHGGSLHFSWANPVGALFLALERSLRAQGHGVIFESEFAARAYTAKIGRPMGIARVIPNGLRAVDFEDANAGEPAYDAVFVGELRTLKGVQVLIDAVAALNAKRSFRLAIAGSGPDEAAFRAAVAAKGLDGRIDFLGHRPARQVFAMGRMIVAPSLAESFPYVVLEAAASGKPVVATKVGGIPEIFGPYAGVLVAPGDAAALADAMARMLDRPVAAQALAESLKQRAKDVFSATRMAEDVTRFYAEVRRAQTARTAASVSPIKLQETQVG
jgi:glycosyltransferase involved in cell wall biosynthesis